MLVEWVKLMGKNIPGRPLAWTYVLAALIISGCTFNQPTGTPFVELPPPTGKTALVYVYRSKGESFGYNRTYYLHANGKKIADLLHGGYFPYNVQAGKLVLIADVNTRVQPILFTLLEEAIDPGSARLVMDVEAGKTYFVKFTPTPGAFVFRLKMDRVSMAQGLGDLRSTQLLQPVTD